jgi:hypothetical protein
MNSLTALRQRLEADGWRVDFHPVLVQFLKNPETLCGYAQVDRLVWEGCVRPRGRGSPRNCHKYPDHLKAEAKAKGIKVNSLSNGPARFAFKLCGGVTRGTTIRGEDRIWPVDHIYDGKFPFSGSNSTTVTHAAYDGRHFTRSGGLVIMHPDLHYYRGRSSALTWYFRYQCFLKFGYDPDHVFG